MAELLSMPNNKPMRLQNVLCPYCGSPLSDNISTDEHVVGRKFVPRGFLENEFNLILNACAPCNNKKSDLEDDIAAITMQPEIGEGRGSDTQIDVDARRKAQGSRSRQTGKLVRDSRTKFDITGELLPGVAVTFGIIGPPQIEETRAFELALLHFQAFFYLHTYSFELKRGGGWPGLYAPIQATSRSDWGNERVQAFMKTTRNWESCVHLTTARSHFRMAIRKHPSEFLWSLAVEWNKKFRVVATCGQEPALVHFVDGLPKLKMELVSRSQNKIIRSRREIPLKEEDDMLFEVPPL